jgi:hypothetical protein
MRLRYKKKECKKSKNSSNKTLRQNTILLAKVTDQGLNKPKSPLTLILTNNTSDNTSDSINDK